LANLEENEKQNQAEVNPEKHVEQKTQLYPEDDVEVSPRVLKPEIAEEAPPMPLDLQKLYWLQDQPFTFENATDTFLVLWLLGRNGIIDAIEKAESRYNNWLRKRGHELSRIAQVKHRENAHLFALLETVIGSACDHLGIGGGQRGEYLCFAKHLLGRIRKRYLNAWLKEAEQAYQSWKPRERLKPEFLRIFAHLTLKTMHFYLENTRPVGIRVS